MPEEYSSLLLANGPDLERAKRLSGIVNDLAVCQPYEVLANSWIAVRLSDGGTDGVLYDSRRDAVLHQAYEKQCAYLHLRAAPGGMQVREAYAFLKFHRDAYDSGYTFIDPEHPTGGVDMCMPIAREDVRAQIHRMRTRQYSKTRKG